MLIRRPLPEFHMEIVCDNLLLQVFDGYGQLIEEREIEAPTWVDMAKEVEKVEEEMLEAAQGMEL